MKQLLLGAILYTMGMAAQASLIHEFSSSIGTGQIEFTADTGSDTSGIAAFSFNADSAFIGGAHAFSLADILSVNWTIDSQNWELDLILETSVVPADFNPTVSVCLGLATIPGNIAACNGFGVGFGSSGTVVYGSPTQGTAGSALSTTAVHAPEPATTALLGLGLAALGIRQRRQRQRA